MQSLWMLVASLFFSLMGVCVKLASSTFTTSEIVMYRGAFGMLFMLAMTRTHRVSLVTTMPLRHLSRGLVGVTSLWMWFYAINKLPLALANTLNYMSPIWIAVILFGANLWRRRSDRAAWLHFGTAMPAAILFSFLGVVVLLHPSIQSQQLPVALVALGSSVFTALAYLQVRKLGLLGEPATRIVFYFSLIGTACGAGLNALHGDWHVPQGWNIVLLLLVGLFASLAQLAMTRAYRLGNPLLTANLSYCGIVFSSVLGVVIWHDQLSWVSWTGIAIILISGILAAYVQTTMRLADAGATD